MKTSPITSTARHGEDARRSKKPNAIHASQGAIGRHRRGRRSAVGGKGSRAEQGGWGGQIGADRGSEEGEEVLRIRGGGGKLAGSQVGKPSRTSRLAGERWSKMEVAGRGR